MRLAHERVRRGYYTHLRSLRDNTPVESTALGGIYGEEKRQVLLHEVGHKILGARNPADVKGSV